MLDFTEAINWALQQNVELEGESTKITVNNPHFCIDCMSVCDYKE